MATTRQKKKVEKVMHEHKRGTLRSGSGKKVKAANRRSRSRCLNPASPGAKSQLSRPRRWSGLAPGVAEGSDWRDRNDAVAAGQQHRSAEPVQSV
jgi:hypothetical protein